MKKFIVAFGVVALFAGTTSCKKIYTCTCGNISVDSDTKMSKKDAEEWCETGSAGLCTLD